MHTVSTWRPWLQRLSATYPRNWHWRRIVGTGATRCWPSSPGAWATPCTFSRLMFDTAFSDASLAMPLCRKQIWRAQHVKRGNNEARQRGWAVVCTRSSVTRHYSAARASPALAVTRHLQSSSASGSRLLAATSIIVMWLRLRLALAQLVFLLGLFILDLWLLSLSVSVWLFWCAGTPTLEIYLCMVLKYRLWDVILHIMNILLIIEQVSVPVDFMDS